jgi:hypothetical protein
MAIIEMLTAISGSNFAISYGNFEFGFVCGIITSLRTGLVFKSKGRTFLQFYVRLWFF